MELHGLQITWLGHGTVLFQTPEGKRVLFDGWVHTNPVCPEESKRLGGLDALLVTHGHSDHTADVQTIAAESQPGQVVAVVELATWLAARDVPNTLGMNKGGTVEVAGMQVTMVHAEHTSSVMEGDRVLPTGEAVGYVLRLADGFTIYAAGDTAIHSDMRLIGQLYAPQVAILPIGDFYTMGPRQAAYAAGMLGVHAVVPIHYGTFPALAGTPAQLRAELAALNLGHVEVPEQRPGETLR